MTSLNLASNNICLYGNMDGIKAISSAIKVLASLRSFWYHFHLYLTSRSTAGVCYYPQDMGALSVTNVMGNHIGKEQLAKLQEIMRSKPNLVSLCGIADDATEADLSGLGMDADDAAILASELPDKGAISSVNVLGNEIGIEQAQVLAAILKEHPTLKSLCGHKGDETELNMSGKEIGVEGAIMLAPEIVDNGAMTSLNLALNGLRAEGAKIVAEAIKVTMCVPAIIMAPFSCPSDFSINCCCLLLSAEYGGDDKPESCVEWARC
jgi:hypothetical protein